MNVQEILEDADLLAPNSFSNALKIKWINQVQKQLFHEIQTLYSSPPSDIQETQLTFVPRVPVEYHELLSLGLGKRMAERVQDFKLAEQLEARFQQLLLTAKINTAPTLTRVQINRSWM